jgi:hypothetical protein
MANNFSSISFPLEGNKLNFRICYHVVSKSLPRNKRAFSLDFDFKYIENSYAQEAISTWPTVESLSEELKRLVLKKCLPLLGKNVHITGYILTAGNNSVHVHAYEFGLGTRNAISSDTSLYFVLQPVTRRKSYRLYVKGASLDLQTIPLSDSDKSAIYSFETLFTSVLSLFDGSLLLQYTRNNDFMISCVFRESVKFSSASSSDIKPLPRPNKSVLSSKNKRPSTKTVARSK